MMPKLAGGGEKLVVKLPDTTTGNTTVQLQFWSRETGFEPKRKEGSCHGWTVASWEDYLYSVAQESIQSPTCGFPKSLDFHFSYDCIDSDCLLDTVKERLEAGRHPYRWLPSPQGGNTWWLLYFPDPTGYGIETHFVRWKNPPINATFAPGCFGVFPNKTCPGQAKARCCIASFFFPIWIDFWPLLGPILGPTWRPKRPQIEEKSIKNGIPMLHPFLHRFFVEF